MKRIIIIKTGSTMPDFAAQRGDFEDWFIEGFGLPRARFDVVDVTPRTGTWKSLPARIDGIAAVVVTGSHAMVTDREPWSEASAAWLARVVDANLPLLGVCYGHQLLAHGMGGQVGDNPDGRESGSMVVTLSAAGQDDPLLGGLGGEVLLNVSHSQSVLLPPTGATILAASPADSCHAMRVGERAWGLQFHPEFDAGIMAAYVAQHGAAIRAAGGDLDALLAACRPTPAGRKILERFVKIAGLA